MTYRKTYPYPYPKTYLSGRVRKSHRPLHPTERRVADRVNTRWAMAAGRNRDVGGTFAALENTVMRAMQPQASWR